MGWRILGLCMVVGALAGCTGGRPTTTSAPPGFVRALPDTNEYQPLLTKENAVRMRSGLVTLGPGENCGWHSTDEYEEFIVCLAGAGHVESADGERRPLAGGQVAYNPPRQRHCVFNTGAERMRYVYVVAPALDTAASSDH